MIRKEFSINRMPFNLPEYNNCPVTLEAGGIIDIMTDDPNEADRIKTEVLMSAQTLIDQRSRSTRLEEIPDMTVEIESLVSEKITGKYGTDCIIKFDYILPDERSQKIIDDMDKMKKFSDPAYAAAELERAMKKAQETAEKNGMSQQDIENIKNAPLPDLPPLPDTDDPIARARAITARVEQMKQMAMNGSFAAPAAPAGIVPSMKDLPPQPRPKYCANCGSKLPESGNFCPNCGAKI